MARKEILVDHTDADNPRFRTSFTRPLVLVLLAAAVFRLVVTGAAPVFDPTEGRYAEIARNMADTGDWVTPRLWVDGEHVPFLGKPPLFFWTAALSIRVFGANEFAVRLPSFLAGAALLFLMFTVLSRYLGRSVAESAVLMTLTSAIFFFLSGASPWTCTSHCVSPAR